MFRTIRIKKSKQNWEGMFCDMKTLKIDVQVSRVLQSFSGVDTSSSLKKVLGCDVLLWLLVLLDLKNLFKLLVPMVQGILTVQQKDCFLKNQECCVFEEV